MYKPQRNVMHTHANVNIQVAVWPHFGTISAGLPPASCCSLRTSIAPKEQGQPCGTKAKTEAEAGQVQAAALPCVRRCTAAPTYA